MASEPRIVRAVVPAALPGGATSTEYDIVVQPGLMAQAGQHVAGLKLGHRAIVITDSEVGPRYGEVVRKSLGAAGIEPAVVTIEAGEAHKTIDTVSHIYDEVFKQTVERATPVIALGGGVIGDMAGFVAATLLRGVPFVQVPTTLLSMVDASVGGKAGVNHAAGKNLIGAFHQPRLVLIDPAVLKTLPERELRSGLAECIKHEIIRDAAGFVQLEKNIERALAMDVEYLADLIAHNVAIKARVVQNDPFEKGERAHLNFGHTFGHAIETVSRYSYAHGECVALGMVAAARLAHDLKMLDAESVARIVMLIGRAGLPTGGVKLNLEEVLGTMLYDKKVRGGRVRFVLPDRIGNVVIRDDVPAEMVRAATLSLWS